MASFSDWTDKDVVMKLSFADEAIMATVRRVDGGIGVWLKSPDFDYPLSPAAEGVVMEDAIFFVPFHLIQWVKSADHRS